MKARTDRIKVTRGSNLRGSDTIGNPLAIPRDHQGEDKRIVSQSSIRR